MAIVQSRPKHKESGKPYKQARKKRLYELGRRPVMTKLGEDKRKDLRVRGGIIKELLLEAKTVNLLDKKTNKYVKATITNVVENSANRNFVRRNIITKGTIVETDKGKAKILSRPGQEGSLNAVLL